MMANAAAPLSAFISYSHRDEEFKDELVVHLANLKRQGKIQAWQDRDIEAGTEWDTEIKQQLESADLILLLITPRFLASDYCYDLEMQRAVQRHNEGTARVIPIIVKPCDWQGTPFSKLQVVPKDAKPITTWNDQDDAFLNVVQSIRKAVESLQSGKDNSLARSSHIAPKTAQNHNLTEKQLAFLKWMIREVRAGTLDEEEIWFTWTFSGTSIVNYEGRVPETKPATLEALQSDRCITCERRTNSEYRFSLTRRAYDIADSIPDIEQESDTSKKAIGATTSSVSVVAPTRGYQFSTYNPTTFTGRDIETFKLINLLKGNCRILTIVGMTGIGKTALAERVVANVMDYPHPISLAPWERDYNPVPLLPGEQGLGDEGNALPYYRFSLDDRSLTPDFASSGAALLRELGEEPTLADQQDPANLVGHILERLRRQPCRVQIDSLERLLRGNEQEGWSEFCDLLWLDLLQKFLAGTDCPSQLLLTSQDIPGDLDAIASRYPQFWHCEPLQGLNADEQCTLFQNLGLTPSDADWELLERIGAFYNGHPLVLQVIAEEIRQRPFQGNIRQYWHHYEAEFTTTAPATATKLDRSRLFRRRVRQRVEQTIQRLPESARQMLCACAVFRRPVPIKFWYAMLPCDMDVDAAFNTLQDRHLVEYTHPITPLPHHSPTPLPLLIRQHNLIRSVAYALLKAHPPTWKAAERQAACLWLTTYETPADISNLETARGYLDAFEHYFIIEDWTAAANLLKIQDFPVKDCTLFDWLYLAGYYQEQVIIYEHISPKITNWPNDFRRACLADAYNKLGRFEKAIVHCQSLLNTTDDIEDLINSFRVLTESNYLLGDYRKVWESSIRFLEFIANKEIDCFSSLQYLHSFVSIVFKAMKIKDDFLDEFSKFGELVKKSIQQSNGETSCSSNEVFLDDICSSFILEFDLTTKALGTQNFRPLKMSRHLIEAIFQASKDNDKAKENFLIALECARESNSLIDEIDILKELIELHWKLGETEVAKQYCQQTLTLATDLGIPLKAKCEMLLQSLGGDDVP